MVFTKDSRAIHDVLWATSLLTIVLGGCDADTYQEEPCSISAHITCPENKYCYFSDRHCGETTHEIGVCVFRPSECSDLTESVCGCDGKAHKDRCSAGLEGSDNLVGCVP
jgi:hypothetical protein